MIAVRRARPEDVDTLSETLSRAFVCDPVASYIFPDAGGRPDLLRRFFTLQLRHNYLPRGEVYTTDDLVAASLWMAPRAVPPRLVDRLAHLRFAPSLLGRVGATRRLTRLLEAKHPVVPHYYLGTLGTDPKHQGEGLGSALLQVVVCRADAAHLPIYLECSLYDNVAFYARHGFKVISEVETPDGKVPLWLMWREPRG